MFAKFSGTDDSSWDMGCICCCCCELLLLESSMVPADDDDGGGGGGTDVAGGTDPATTLFVVVVPGPAGCGAVVAIVAATDGVPGIGCCAGDSAGA